MVEGLLIWLYIKDSERSGIGCGWDKRARGISRSPLRGRDLCFGEEEAKGVALVDIMGRNSLLTS